MKRVLPVLLLVAGFLRAAPARAADETAPGDAQTAPPPEPSPRGAVLGVGISFLANGYAVALQSIVGCAIAGGCGSHGYPLAIPVVGPFVEMAVTQKPGGNALLAVDGVAQVSGLLLIVASRLLPAQPRLPGRLTLTPVLGRGVGVAGVF